MALVRDVGLGSVQPLGAPINAGTDPEFDPSGGIDAHGGIDATYEKKKENIYKSGHSFWHTYACIEVM